MNGMNANSDAAPAPLATTITAAASASVPETHGVGVKTAAKAVASGVAVEVDVLTKMGSKENGNASKVLDIRSTPVADETDVDQHEKAESDLVHTPNSHENITNGKIERHAPSLNGNNADDLKQAGGSQLPALSCEKQSKDAGDVENIHTASSMQVEPENAEGNKLPKSTDEANIVAQDSSDASKVVSSEADQQKQDKVVKEEEGRKKVSSGNAKTSQLEQKAVPKESAAPEVTTVLNGKLTKEQKEISKMIADTVSEDAAKQYTQATEIVHSAPSEEELQTASALLVKALQSAEDKDQAGLAYAELSLTYGQLMLGFVIRRATGSGVLGDGVKEEEAEEAEEDVVDEEEDEQITWTQLEIARITFEKLIDGGNERLKGRLAETHRTLGELLVALDQASQAGDEFGKASKLCEGRNRAECLHKLYLAMRREDKGVAANALRECITALEGVGTENDENVLSELKDELRLFAGESEGNGEVAETGRATEVKVVKVMPRRKRKGETTTGADAAAKRERRG